MSTDKKSGILDTDSDTKPNSPVKGKTGNQPAKQKENGVKEAGKGETNPETSTPNTDASADAE